jgi:tetratricopeptide (TPR) repeat protein
LGLIQWLDPEYTYAFNNRGLAYADLKQFKKAIQDYNQAIELNPKDFNAFNGRGTVYIKLKQFEKAIQDYNQAIELDPKYTHAFNNRGTAYIPRLLKVRASFGFNSMAWL